MFHGGLFTFTDGSKRKCNYFAKLLDVLRRWWYGGRMKIDELDEWQGLTAEHVTNWLHAHGWETSRPNWWEKGDDGFLFDAQTFDQQWFWTHALAAIYTAGNVQALLREISPRMRKGCPSNAAIQAHDGPWLELRGASRLPGVTEFGSDPDQGQREWIEDYCKDALFWPCDRYGNKVRWPTDANGVML